MGKIPSLKLSSKSRNFWFFYVAASRDRACEPMNPNKCLSLEKYSSLEEEQCTKLNQKYKQLHSENWTHVEQLKSTDEREKMLDNSNHVRKTQ